MQNFFRQNPKKSATAQFAGADVSSPSLPPPNVSPTSQDWFDAPIVLKQSTRNSQWMLWLLVGSTVAAIAWANVAKIEEAIPVQGKLEPQGQVKNVQVPINGVIRKINVKDGQAVKAGDVLLEVDPDGPKAQLKSLQVVRTNLEQENQFYQSQLDGTDQFGGALRISPQMLSLTKSRSALMAENRFYQSQLDGSVNPLAMTDQERSRLQAEQMEASSRAMAVELAINQLQQQVNQAEERRKNAVDNLQLEEGILKDITPLAESGGISRVQFLKQKQTVDNKRSEIIQIQQEKAKLQAEMAQAGAKVVNNVAVDRKDHTTKISGNLQKLAEIDSQLSKAIVENNKKIAEINSQVTQAAQLLKYSAVKAPVSGVIFNLKANSPGYVANPSEAILTIVPSDSLVAKVMITNRDIGFVRPGMPVDVRIDSFPFSEFGDLKGELVAIGSDALPPSDIQPFYKFPAVIKLSRQSLNANGRTIRLQSGMSLNANIRVRERTVMSVFTDSFVKASESLKFIR
jgi:hemolysin D